MNVAQQLTDWRELDGKVILGTSGAGTLKTLVLEDSDGYMYYACIGIGEAFVKSESIILSDKPLSPTELYIAGVIDEVQQKVLEAVETLGGPVQAAKLLHLLTEYLDKEVGIEAP